MFIVRNTSLEPGTILVESDVGPNVIEVPCDTTGARPNNTGVNDQSFNQDDNSCIEGSVLGGIAGAAVGGIPLKQVTRRLDLVQSLWGVVGGSMVGCQIDGG